MPVFRFILDELELIDKSTFCAVNFMKQIFELMHSVGGALISPKSISKNISYINNRFVPCKR